MRSMIERFGALLLRFTTGRRGGGPRLIVLAIIRPPP
jgi:hypothetical protein